jgi:hypothetical protein
MRWRLFRQFILRRLLAGAAPHATTIVGIALGIAVVIAIQLTNASSVRGFETALDTDGGAHVGRDRRARAASTRRCCPRSAGCASSESVARSSKARWRPCSPMADAMPAPSAARLRVLGVDILRDLTLRDYGWRAPGVAMPVPDDVR